MPESLQEMVRIHLVDGMVWHGEGKYDDAIACFDKAIEIDPNVAEVRRWRGDAYGETGDVDRAIAEFDKAIALDPNDATFYDDRGRAYAKKGEVDRALADYTKAIEIDPNFFNAYANRGLAYAERGDFDRVIADYDKALALDPNDATAYNIRGDAYAQKGEHDRSIRRPKKSKKIRRTFRHAVATPACTQLFSNDGIVQAHRVHCSGDCEIVSTRSVSAYRYTHTWVRPIFREYVAQSSEPQ